MLQQDKVKRPEHNFSLKSAQDKIYEKCMTINAFCLVLTLTGSHAYSAWLRMVGPVFDTIVCN